MRRAVAGAPIVLLSVAVNYDQEPDGWDSTTT
jgi:hypothetical protein